MNPNRVRELLKQPARVYKMAAKRGLDLRKDTKNPGVYHVYKPGGPGSTPDFNLTESTVKNRADEGYLKNIISALNKAWPGNEVIYDPKAWADKVQI